MECGFRGLRVYYMIQDFECRVYDFGSMVWGAETDRVRGGGTALARESHAMKLVTASERKGNNLKDFKGFDLKARARIWP